MPSSKRNTLASAYPLQMDEVGDAVLKISTRPLLFGLASLLLLVGIGMAVSVLQLHQMAQTLDDVMHEDATAESAIFTMMQSARARLLRMNEALDLSDPFEREEKLLEFERLAGEFRGARQRLLALPLSPEEQLLLKHQNGLLNQLMRHFEQILALARDGDLLAARETFKADAIPAQTNMLDTLIRWAELRQTQYGMRAEQVRGRQRDAVSVILGVAVVALLLGGLVAALVYRWNRRAIDRLTMQQARLHSALAEQAIRQRALDEHSIVSMTDASGNITYVNDKFCQVSGYSRAELLGANHRIVNAGHHPAEFFQSLWQTITAGRIWRGEVKNRAKDGRPYWVQTTILPMLDEQGLPMRYISVRTEISHIMEMEEKVRAANLILQSNVIERTQQLELAKLELERELADRVRTQAELQRSFDELQILHRQLQETQQYLMHSEKLAAVGQLAAGMAHEINNPIGYVASNLSMLRRYQDTLAQLLERYRQAESSLAEAERDDLVESRRKADLDFLLEDARALLDETGAGVERVRKIVQDLRDFSQVDSSGEWQWADLNHILDSTLNLFGERLSAAVEVRREYGAVPRMECQPAELSRVFFNLLNNALQAMPQGGRLTLRSGHEGDRVFVEIEDTGSGIADKVRLHIFEPFFTTRPVGQGAGLGLSLAYAVVQQHGGEIGVRSLVGAGSAFRVSLPVRQPLIPAPDQSDALVHAPQDSPTGMA
jgi:PAS domain S-box-containing protein